MEAINTNRPPSERTKEASNKTTLMRMVSQIMSWERMVNRDSCVH